MLRGKQSLTLIRALVLLQVVVLRGKQSPKPERRLTQGDFCGDNMVFDELSLVEYPHLYRHPSVWANCLSPQQGLQGSLPEYQDKHTISKAKEL